MYREHLSDLVKFRSITMALWIKKDYKIPIDSLKQLMCNLNSDILRPQAMIRALFIYKWRD